MSLISLWIIGIMGLLLSRGRDFIINGELVVEAMGMSITRTKFYNDLELPKETIQSSKPSFTRTWSLK